MPTTKTSFVPLALIATALVIGCDKDKRLVEFAQEADQRQAEQNHEIAKQNHEIAAATKNLVEADAKARQELVALERDLQTERATIGEQRDHLEAERRELATQRRRESLLAQLLAGGATLVACLLPLVLCWYLLQGLRSQSHDEALGELLVMELASGASSPLLPAPEYRPPPDGLFSEGLLADGPPPDGSLLDRPSPDGLLPSCPAGVAGGAE